MTVQQRPTGEMPPPRGGGAGRTAEKNSLFLISLIVLRSLGQDLDCEQGQPWTKP